MLKDHQPAQVMVDADQKRMPGDRTAGLDLYVGAGPERSVTTSVLLFAIDWQKGHGFFYGTQQGS